LHILDIHTVDKALCDANVTAAEPLVRGRNSCLHAPKRGQGKTYTMPRKLPGYAWRCRRIPVRRINFVI